MSSINTYSQLHSLEAGLENISRSEVDGTLAPQINRNDQMNFNPQNEESETLLQHNIKRGEEIVRVAASGSEYEPDRLGMVNDARALAQLIAFKDLSPRFTVGLLGGKGSGKTFLFNLIEQELINIQHKYRKDRKNPYEYAGHIYVVRFDAWTFSKGDIWSSFIFNILAQLNEQVQVEEILRKYGREEYSLLEEYRRLRKNDIEYLAKYPIERDEISKSLADIVQEEYMYLQEDLYVLQTELERMQSALEKIDKELNEIDKRRKAKIEYEKVLEKIGCLHGSDVKDMVVQHLHEWQTNGDPEEGELLKSIEDLLNSNKMLWTVFTQGKFTAFIVFLFGLIIAVPVVMTVQLGRVDSVLVPIIGLIPPALTAAGRFVMKYNQIIIPLKEDVFQLFNAQNKGAVESRDNFEDEIEKKKMDRQFHLESIEYQEKRIDAIDKQRRLLRGQFLKEFLEEQDESNPNTVHQAQKDLELLSKALLNHKNQDQFPRGKARIVLFIDNLDRCNEKMVVETFEALKFLVRTEAFVVVVGIDMQYVTLALENNSKGILKLGTHSSCLDYLEEIIQLPYRIPPMRSKDDVHSYVTSLIGTNLKKRESEAVVDVKYVDRYSFDHNAQTMVKLPDDIERNSFETTVASQIQFSEIEKKMLIRVFMEVSISPRAIKRIINVLKIMKIVCDRDVMSNNRILEALISILALLYSLNSNVSTAMCDVLARFEKSSHKKTNVSGNTTLFEILFGKNSLDDEDYLKKEHNEALLKWKDIEINKENFVKTVQSIHRVRCFSFV